MSFWSTLAKIGGDIGGAFIGDPMLGNQIMDGGQAIFGGGEDDGSNFGTDLSQLLGGMAGNRADARTVAATLALKRGGLANDIFTSATNAKALESALDTKNYDNTIRGLKDAQMQDVSVSAPDNVAPHVVHFSGGMRPSMIGQAGRTMGDNFAKFASSKIGHEGLPAPPDVPDLPEGNVLDSILGVAGPAAGFGGILAKYLSKRGGGSAIPDGV